MEVIDIKWHRARPPGLFFGKIGLINMKATLDRIDEISLVALNLWPHHSLDDIKNVINKYIQREDTSVFICVIDGKCVGVALVSLRHDYVEGCATSPVGYLEGICVENDYRKSGVASKLCKECEDWAKGQRMQRICFRLRTEQRRILPVSFEYWF